jgi:hypothetical protein
MVGLVADRRAQAWNGLFWQVRLGRDGRFGSGPVRTGTARFGRQGWQGGSGIGRARQVRSG